MADDPVLVDASVLLTATEPARRQHLAARAVLDDWPSRGTQLCTSGQILREYLVVATRPADVNGFDLTLEEALANVGVFRERLRFLEEISVVANKLESLINGAGCLGRQIHDANLVATAVSQGVSQVLTANPQDFLRFESLISVLDLAQV